MYLLQQIQDAFLKDESWRIPISTYTTRWNECGYELLPWNKLEGSSEILETWLHGSEEHLNQRDFSSCMGGDHDGSLLFLSFLRSWKDRIVLTVHIFESMKPPGKWSYKKYMLTSLVRGGGIGSLTVLYINGKLIKSFFNYYWITILLFS